MPHGHKPPIAAGHTNRPKFGTRQVDEIILLIVPVLLGQGTRLFPRNGPDTALELVESGADSKGVTIQVYRPAGRPRYAPAVLPEHVT